MILADIWNLFESKVFPYRSSEVLFNQYNDISADVDLPNADIIRRENLKNYLKSFSELPTTLLVGEAPGPWGCRFSGVPFTTQEQLYNNRLPFSGRRSSKNHLYDVLLSKGKSAKIFWDIMLPCHPHFFVWNCIPFHPHKHGEILSIRNPSRREVLSFSEILSEIRNTIHPKHIIAVGRKAEHALNGIGVSPTYIRHPSHGGETNFKIGIKEVFRSHYIRITEL